MVENRDKSKCCACFSCYIKCPTKAIDMIPDEEGFLYPKVNTEKCTKCGLCKKVSPYEIGDVSKDNILTPKNYAAKSLDTENIKLSSSGGIFFELAKYIIKNGGIVFGAGFDKEFNVVHKAIDKEENLHELKGSKYVQSYMGKTYREIKKSLDEDKFVFFVGTPCQVAGLYAYLNKEKYEKLFTADLICHGVPSPKFYRKYIDEIQEKNNSKAQAVYFRDKTEGWSKFSMKIKFENGTIYRKRSTEDVYMQAFLRNMSLRKTCYDCKFSKLPRVADITLGDFWGITKYYPEIDENNLGTSEILANSKKGKYLLNQIKDKIFMKEVDLELGIIDNPCLVGSVKEPSKRKRFFNDIDKYSIGELDKKYFGKPSIARIIVIKMKEKIYNFIKK